VKFLWQSGQDETSDVSPTCCPKRFELEDQPLDLDLDLHLHAISDLTFTS
jgi:hypothetical protein